MESRRNFLKKSVVAGAAAALTPSSMMSINHSKNVSAITTPHNTYTVNMRTAMNIPVIQPKEITIPNTAGFKVLKGDFHIHTLLLLYSMSNF